MLIFWERLWNIIFSKPEPVGQEIIIFVSIFYWSCTMLLSRGIRGCLRTLLRRHWMLEYAQDTLCTIEVCAVGLENSCVRKHYGMWWYLFGSACCSMWFLYSLDNSSTNPCTTWIKYITAAHKSCGFCKTITKISLQLAAGLVAYQYGRLWWSLCLSSEHALRHRTTGCTSDLRVSVFAGFMIEAAATAANYIATAVLFASLIKSEHFQQLLTQLFGAALTWTGIDLTGMYVNPSKAVAQTFGCEGSAAWEHCLVYCAAPLAGVSVIVAASRSSSSPAPSPTQLSAKLRHGSHGGRLLFRTLCHRVYTTCWRYPLYSSASEAKKNR